MSLPTTYLIIQTILLIVPSYLGLNLVWYTKFFPTIIVLIYYCVPFILRRLNKKR